VRSPGQIDDGRRTTTDYLIDSILVLLVLFQVKEHMLTNRQLIRPLVILGVAVASYLHAIPTQGNSATLPDELTSREAEVLTLIARGLSNHEIAAALFGSKATVKTHINHVFAKIDARDRAQAVHYAYTHGLAG
jgi:DNA-binding NarL/FixJ family response regulator